jgi:hypothetical protein
MAGAEAIAFLGLGVLVMRNRVNAAGGGGGPGQERLAVKPDGDAETFWQRFLATYRFRRRFGRESWWASFRGAIRAAWGDGADGTLNIISTVWVAGEPLIGIAAERPSHGELALRRVPLAPPAIHGAPNLVDHSATSALCFGTHPNNPTNNARFQIKHESHRGDASRPKPSSGGLDPFLEGKRAGNEQKRKSQSDPKKVKALCHS